MIEYILLGILGALVLLNVIIYRNKLAIIKGIIGLVFLLIYIPFKFVSFLNNYMYIYEIINIAALVLFALFFIPKKVTRNLTEYDVFELESSLKDEQERVDSLKSSFLTMIDIMDEGVILYQGKKKSPYLSEKSKELFPNEDGSEGLAEHAEFIYPDDKMSYIRTIERVSYKFPTYSIKYRVIRNSEIFWVQEDGKHVITKSGEESIVSVVRPLDITIFEKTGYVIIDSMPMGDKLLPRITDLIKQGVPFTLSIFELTNIADVNEKFGRQVGSLLMNEYIKIIKSTYAKDSKDVFRLSGVRFAMIITDDRYYDSFHKAVINNSSILYNTKIPISELKETVKPKFGVVNVSGAKSTDPNNVVHYATQLLKEAKESSKKNYAIFGE